MGIFENLLQLLAKFVDGLCRGWLLVFLVSCDTSGKNKEEEEKKSQDDPFHRVVLRVRWTGTDHLTSGSSNLVVEIVHDTLQGFRHGLCGVLGACQTLGALAEFVDFAGH